MERLHMNQIREIIHRLQQGESGRQIAKDLHVSRHTIAKYHEIAKQEGYLCGNKTLPSGKELMAKLGPPQMPPAPESGVAPYKQVVERLLDDGVEKMAILGRLRDDYGYRGTYSSLWRFVNRLRPSRPEAFVRIHTEPGEEAQVDFGTVGTLLDPREDRPRTAYVFVMTLFSAATNMPSWCSTRRSAPGSPAIAAPSRALADFPSGLWSIMFRAT